MTESRKDPIGGKARDGMDVSATVRSLTGDLRRLQSIVVRKSPVILCQQRLEPYTVKDITEVDVNFSETGYRDCMCVCTWAVTCTKQLAWAPPSNV